FAQLGENACETGLFAQIVPVFVLVEQGGVLHAARDGVLQRGDRRVCIALLRDEARKVVARDPGIGLLRDRLAQQLLGEFRIAAAPCAGAGLQQAAQILWLTRVRV